MELGPDDLKKLSDPLLLAKVLWPNVKIYSKQRQVLKSLQDNDETYVVAGNMLGKDWIAAFVVLWFFLTRHPCRVLTTSADYEQLEAVLWGELGNWINTSAYPLKVEKGGPLVVQHLHIKKIVHGEECKLSYIRGRVAAKGEGMLGHHIANVGDGIPRTLFVADEASGVDDLSYERASTWAQRVLVIGNPWPCSNFFFKAVEKGDVAIRPVIHEASPLEVS